MANYITTEGTKIYGEIALCTHLVRVHNEACHELDTDRLAELCQRFEIFEYIEPPDAPKPEAEIRAGAVAEIKEIRGRTLDKFPKGRAGVLMVYDTNVEAAKAFFAGDTAPLRTGMTPEQHLALGLNYGMDATQFANYVIAENVRLGPSSWDVEDRYSAALMLAYYAPVAYIDAAVTAYREWCDTVSGS